MPTAPEFQLIRPGVAFWQAYDPSVKTDLSCCAVTASEGIVFVDPVGLASDALDELLGEAPPLGIVLTNGNHARSAASLAERLGVDIWAHTGAKGEVPATRWFADGDLLFGSLRAVGLEGFVPGEAALAGDDFLIFGDALIHAPPFGFAILPEKYCTDQKAGRASLRKLLQFPVEVLIFAHGLPIVSRARERLAALIS